MVTMITPVFYNTNWFISMWIIPIIPSFLVAWFPMPLPSKDYFIFIKNISINTYLYKLCFNGSWYTSYTLVLNVHDVTINLIKLNLNWNLIIELKIVPFYQLDSEMSMVIQFCGFTLVKNSNKVNVEIIHTFYVIYHIPG